MTSQRLLGQSVHSFSRYYSFLINYSITTQIEIFFLRVKIKAGEEGIKENFDSL